MNHEYAIEPEEFALIQAGVQVAVIRPADDIEPGDTILHREFLVQTCRYTGNQLAQRIVHVVRAPARGLAPGYAMLSLCRANGGVSDNIAA